jgi:hypothetical protein
MRSTGRVASAPNRAAPEPEEVTARCLLGQRPDGGGVGVRRPGERVGNRRPHVGSPRLSRPCRRGDVGIQIDELTGAEDVDTCVLRVSGDLRARPGQSDLISKALLVRSEKRAIICLFKLYPGESRLANTAALEFSAAAVPSPDEVNRPGFIGGLADS